MTMTKGEKYEKFSSLFLRLNGYFLVDNYVVHGADDPEKIKEGVVSQFTEVDTLAVRMPYQVEQSGGMIMQNYIDLILQDGKMDFVILETKSGQKAKPNSTWTSADNPNSIATVKYILNHFGYIQGESEKEKIAVELLQNFNYTDDDFSFRFIMVANEENKHYSDRGVKFITVDKIIEFIVMRGMCWEDSGIGLSSTHQQWDDFMKTIFEFANDNTKDVTDRKAQIKEFLDQ